MLLYSLQVGFRRHFWIPLFIGALPSALRLSRETPKGWVLQEGNSGGNHYTVWGWEVEIGRKCGLAPHKAKNSGVRQAPPLLVLVFPGPGSVSLMVCQTLLEFSCSVLGEEGVGVRVAGGKVRINLSLEWEGRGVLESQIGNSSVSFGCACVMRGSFISYPEHWALLTQVLINLHGVSVGECFLHPPKSSTQTHFGNITLCVNKLPVYSLIIFNPV